LQQKHPWRAVRHFNLAYDKARQWQCPPVQAWLVAVRFALTGNSGRFLSHGGYRKSRIFRSI